MLMYTFRRVSQYLFKNRHLIKVNRRRIFYNSARVARKRFVTFTLGSTLVGDFKNDSNDEELKKACEEGVSGILSLMSDLKDLIRLASEEYRSCLNKQIELIQKASSAESEIWDQLPEYRLLANQLNSELNEYLVLLKTIGEMAYGQSLISRYINEQNIGVILEEYKELEIVLLKEFELNKKTELELLKVNVASIVSENK